MHFRQHQVLNQYQQVICAIAHVLENYDDDKSFPVFGFGALLSNAVTSHCFPLNGNEENPYCNGVQGVFDAYSNALSVVKLSGPTNFSPVIRKVIEMTRKRLTIEDNGSFYDILLILTDGEVTDMDSTVDAIIDASSLPISIVIVGIGNAVFDKMVHLDSDEALLKSSDGARTAVRDIVQFVSYREHAGFGGAKLAKEVLAEIPDHIVEYMSLNNIEPIVRDLPAGLDREKVTLRRKKMASTSAATHKPLIQFSEAEQEILKNIIGGEDEETPMQAFNRTMKLMVDSENVPESTETRPPSTTVRSSFVEAGAYYKGHP